LTACATQKASDLMRALLDVNVLIALHDADHVQHLQAAQRLLAQASL